MLTPAQMPAVIAEELAEKLESLLQLLDPQVRYRYVPLAEEKNAWPMWKRAGEFYVEPPEDEEFQAGLGESFGGPNAVGAGVRQRIVDWVKQNEECRSHIDAGLAREALELPRASAAIRLSLAMDEIHLFRSFAKLKAAVSQIHLYERDVGKAIREAGTILALGSMLVRAECLFVDYLVANAVLGIGVEAIYQAAMATGATDDQAKSVISHLAAAKTSNDHLKQAFRVELCRWFLPHLAGFPDTAEPSLLATYYFAPDASESKPTVAQLQAYQEASKRLATLLEGHPNPLDKRATAALCGQLHARYFASLDTPWPKRDRSAFQEIETELRDWPEGIEPDVLSLAGLGVDPDHKSPTERQLKKAGRSLRTVDNVLGKHLVYTTMMNGPLVEPFHARLEAARLRIALRLHERTAGRLPPTLGALVDGEYLPEVPRDPFDNGQFRYSPERRVVWSVGQKGDNQGLVPEGGASDFDESTALTWRIKRP